jgi:hypothetical protein
MTPAADRADGAPLDAGEDRSVSTSSADRRRFVCTIQLPPVPAPPPPLPLRRLLSPPG